MKRILWVSFLIFAISLIVFFPGFRVTQGTRVQYDSSWHTHGFSPHGRAWWMSDEATLVIYQSTPSLARISYHARSPRIDQTLHLSVEDQTFSYQVSRHWRKFGTPLISLHKGKNILRFKAPEGCRNKPNNSQCRSIIIAGIKASSIEQLWSVPLFDKNWYSGPGTIFTTHQWMADDGVVSLYEPIPKKGHLYFRARTKRGTTKQLQVFLNQNLLGSYEITATPKEIFTPTATFTNANTILFHIKEGCDPVYLRGSKHPRCQSIFVSALKFSYGSQ